jgi:hypothetical protein
MTTTTIPRARIRTTTLLGVVVAALTAVALIRHGVTVDIFKSAMGVDTRTGDGTLDRLAGSADRFATPLLVLMAAALPVCLVVGGGAVMFGSRRGMLIIGGGIGGFLLAAVAKGIAA